MSIGYDVSAMTSAFTKYIAGVLKQLQSEYLAECETHMLTPEGRADLTASEIKDINGMFIAEVIGGTWAVLDEWGIGSLMDTSNPVLDEYRNSDLWNPARYDLAIRGRPAGEYTNIFGYTQISSGRMAGLDLERKPGFEPRPPSHAMQTAMRWLTNGRWQKVLQGALDNFPWGNFIVATPD